MLNLKILVPIIAITFIVIVGGFFAWQHFGTPKQVGCTEEARICPDGSAVGRTGPNCEFAACPADETATWQIYRNEKYGFEIKYPKSNQCKFSENGEGSFSFGRIELSITDSKGLDLVDYANSFIDNDNWIIETRENAITATSESVKLTYRFGGTNRYGEVTFIKNNGDIYTIGYTAGGFTCDEPQIFPQMLSTFKFLKQANAGDAAEISSGAESLKRDIARILSIIEIMMPLEFYYDANLKYPGTTGLNQMRILSETLSSYWLQPISTKDPLVSQSYEYWVSSDGQKYVLKAMLETHHQNLDGDVDGYPLGLNAIFCGAQGSQEREFCNGVLE